MYIMCVFTHVWVCLYIRIFISACMSVYLCAVYTHLCDCANVHVWVWPV